MEGNINLHQFQLESDSSSCEELCDTETEGPLKVNMISVKNDKTFDTDKNVISVDNDTKPFDTDTNIPVNSDTKPLETDKILNSEMLEEPNILEMPEDTSDDGIGFSDTPIMKISSDDKTTKKPKGSAYIHTQMSIGRCNKKSDVYVCIDTGADITICDSAFLLHNFGDNALKHVIVMSKPPRLRSASNHYLKILGKVKVTLFLGTYELHTHIVVYEGKKGIFLLGSDVFYNRLIFDRGIYLAFAENKHPPIPVHYELAPGAVKAITQYQVAPRSNAIIQVKVAQGSQFTGKEVVLLPIDENEHGHMSHKYTTQCEQCLLNPIRNTISKIDSNGNAILLVYNDTDDILTILPEKEIARAELITTDFDDINQIAKDELGIIDISKGTEAIEKWPVSALKGVLKDKIPDNVVVQWSNCHKKDDVDHMAESLKDFETRQEVVDLSQLFEVNYIHDKEEKKGLLDGTGDGFPTPPAASPEDPELPDSGPETWLENVLHSHLSDEQWLKLKNVLMKHKDAFSKSKTEIGCCNYFKVDLPLKPGTGYLYNKPRPLPFKHREIAAETISELLAKGVIRPSKSPHATNIVCVKKKTMNNVVSYRVCCDLRQVNENSIPNRFPNFWIEDAMGKIQGSVYRSALDFKDAFHMLVLTEESIPITAFYFNNVLFEYVRVPFGHICAMNAFCCLMALLCVGYPPSSYYCDDLMITTKSDHTKSLDYLFDLHLEHIEGMLARIIEAGLKLVAHKCMWAYDSSKPMDWLGFTMENNLLKPQDSKVKAIKEYPVPTTAKQVISFVATASFYRRFIKSFAKIAQPMYNVANIEPFVWNDEAQKSFEQLKDIMCSDLVLRLPRQGEPFQMYSDASAGAIGVVLCQIDPVDGKSHPCAYGSRKFNECELKLSIPCKELLAIVYGLNLWSFYICGNPIQVFSDCRAWTFLTKQSGASGRISRLALLISEFDISISYVKGTQNKAADGLSRAYDDGLVKYDDLITARHPALDKLEAPALPPGEIKKLGDYLVQCDKFLETHWPKLLDEYEVNNPKGLDNLPERIKEKELNQPNLENIDNIDNSSTKLDINNVILDEINYLDQVIYEASLVHIDKSKADINRMRNYYPFQINDQEIEDSIQITEESDFSDSETESESEIEGTTDSSFKAACYNIRLVAINESSFSLEAFRELQLKDLFCSEKIDQLKKKRSKASEAGYFMKKKILMRKMETSDGQVNNVLCVPHVLVKPLLGATHRSLLSGHFGSQRYYLNLSRKYYWPKMKDQIMEFHNDCIPCQYNDKYPVKYTSGHVIRPLWPMHIIHCDLMVGLPKALDGSHAILLLYDGFSRFTYGIALTSEKADYIVKKLMSHFVSAFGVPWALHSDNGRNVDGALIRHLALMLGVVKTSTPPHTPNANPTETMCGAVAQLLRKGLNESDKRYWSLGLPFILNALNSTIHTATGYTPNSLFLGRYKEREVVPLIPFDCESANVNEYYQKMRRFQELAFQIVRGRNERRLLAKKDIWDEHARNPPYNVGDYVLIKNVNPASGPGKMKLRSKYIGPFRVIKVYLSSLIVVPWTQNARLEEYYRDPNVFRLMHRGDIKPFHTRQVAVKHCKPFKGEIKAEEIIDPIMLSRFLDDLGIENNAEIISEIDSESTTTISTGSDDSGPPGPPGSVASSNHTPPNPGGDVGSRGHSPPPPGGDDRDDHRPRRPRYDDPDPPERDPPVRDPPKQERDPDNEGNFVRDPEIERFIESLEISDVDKELLRQYCQIKDDMEDRQSFKSIRRLDKIKEFIQSADPMVRHRAEFELQEVISDMKYIKRSGMLDKLSGEYQKLIDKSLPDVENSEKIKSEESSIKNEPIRAESLPASERGSVGGDFDEVASFVDSLAGMPDVEGENSSQHSGSSHDSVHMEWDHGHDIDALAGPAGPPIPDINIALPNININIRQPQVDVINPFARAPRIVRSPDRHGNVEDWIAGRSPQHGPGPPKDLATPYGNPEITPVATRSGRISRPPARFSPATESKLQLDTRTAIRKSLAMQKAVDTFAAKTAKSRSKAVAEADIIPPARQPPVRVEPEKSKGTTAINKPVASTSGFKPLPRSKYDQLSLAEKKAYNEARESIAASKTAAISKPTVARSEKPKSATVKSKSVIPETADGDPVKETSERDPGVDFTARSSKTARTPVKGDTSTIKAPSGANRLSDDDN